MNAESIVHVNKNAILSPVSGSEVPISLITSRFSALIANPCQHSRFFHFGVSFIRRKKLLTGGVNFMLPQGNMKNADSMFRKAIPNSRYLGLCCCG